MIIRTSNLKSDLGATNKSNEDSFELEQEMGEACYNSCMCAMITRKKTSSNRKIIRVSKPLFHI